MRNSLNNLKNVFFLIVFIGFSSCFAGSYDDFFKAIDRDDASTLRQLIGRGFDVNTVSPTGLHGLFLAIAAPSPKAIAVLLQAPGIRVEARNSKDESPLMMAAIGGLQDVCEQLIALDADVNKTGWTPLHYAASRAHDGIVKLLLKHYAYIDAESPNQTTPLMMAAMYGSDSTVELLIQAGADLHLRNAQGLSALDFAQSAGRESSYKLIAQRLQAANRN